MNAQPKFQSYCCPSCGNSIGEAASIADVLAKITQGSQRVIVDRLAKVPGKLVERHTLIAALYGYSDGPIDAEANLSVYLNRLRKQLPPLGWMIKMQGGGRGNLASYRLIPITQSEGI